MAVSTGTKLAFWEWLDIAASCAGLIAGSVLYVTEAV
jgi:hypothetical protein